MIKVALTAGAPTAGQREEEKGRRTPRPRGISSWLKWEEMESSAQEGVREDSNLIKHNEHPLLLLTCQTHSWTQ